MRKKQKLLWLCCILILLNLALIWGNSLATGEQSGEISGSVVETVMEVLDVPPQKEDLLHKLIRKMAHFTEFMCLGMLLSWQRKLRGAVTPVSYPLLLGMAAALVDETIQMFIPDRGPSLTDVWIDTSGTLTGMLLLLTGYYLVSKFKKQNQT